jgi:hypothetical protein
MNFPPNNLHSHFIFTLFVQKTDMKRLLLLLILACTLQIGKAQVNDHAIGVRGGFGGGITYQHGLSDINRAEIIGGFGVNNDALSLRAALAYQWVFDIGVGLNVYAGPSATVGAQFFDTPVGNAEDGLFMLLGGQLGIDYNFQEFPVMLSIDIMPQVGVLNSNQDFYIDPAFAIRYVF